MGFVTVSPGVQLFYEIRPTTATDRRPWLLFLHPTTCDVSLASDFWTDPRFLARFNLIAFDQRHHGRTRAVARGSCDIWSLAADLAIGLHKLHIPPVHIFTGQSWPSEIAVRLTILFPERVASLALCGIGPDVDSPFLKGAFTETINTWSNPDTPDEWDEAISCCQYWLFGDEARYFPDVVDRWAAAIIRRYPPFKALDAFAFACVFIGRTPIPPYYSAQVRQPMLVIHGAADTVYSADEVQGRTLAFTGVEGGVQHRSIHRGSGVPLFTHQDELKEMYLDWLDPLISQSSHSSLSPPHTVFRNALCRLAEMGDRPEVGQRDPTQSNSFSLVPPEAETQVASFMDGIRGLQDLKFGLRGGGSKESWEGAPWEEEVPWRFSERFDEARFCDSTSTSTPRMSASIQGTVHAEIVEICSGEDFDMEPDSFGSAFAKATDLGVQEETVTCSAAPSPSVSGPVRGR